MLNKMCSAIARYNMIETGSKVLVALSGGADSVALLLGLLTVKEKYNLEISAIHINHNLRGEESKRDEIFVKNLCEKLSVPLTVKSVDIALLSKQAKESIELCARKVRYKLFNECSVDKIATAHTANDNAETVIYNLTRGTGLKGIAGIPPVRDNVIRPLITATREEILNFLETNNIAFVTDSTNNEDIYIRNKIRHNIIPKLKNINSGVIDSILNLSTYAREDSEYLEDIANKTFNKMLIGEVLSLDVSALEIPILKRVLINFYNSTDFFTDNLTGLQLNEMLRVVKGEIKRTSLNNNYTFNRINNGFIIEKQITDTNKISEKIELNNIDKLRKHFPNANIVSYEEYVNFQNLQKNMFKYALDCDKIIGTVFLRSREDGDKYLPVGRKVTKSLRKLLTESKLSLKTKSNLKILQDDKGIFFTNLFGIDERVKVDENSKNVIVLNDWEGIKCITI